ncbi:MAG TPA: DUF1570 domain-containing protein [Gemmataceae bacterium]|nr:DUF1570 domain-containing protein [Gemmataceae bacterium]
MSMHVAVRRRIWAAATTAALALLVGCHSLNVNAPQRTETRSDGPAPPPLPSKYSFRVAPYVFVSDFEVPRDQPLFQELADMRDQIDKELQLPPSTTSVQVYLFEDRKSYEHFMQARYPDLPQRRAFFIAQPRTIGGADDLEVYTFWGDRIQQDLRHELTHALLHSVIRDVPLWLDEGLAEYFELPPDWKGVNPAHVENMLHTGSFPYKADLPRLEGLTKVEQMTPAEYRESWAWVHLMLRDKPEAKAVLTSYLRQLHQTAAAGLLEPKLAGVYSSPDDAFDRHLAQLDATIRADAGEH